MPFGTILFCSLFCGCFAVCSDVCPNVKKQDHRRSCSYVFILPMHRFLAAVTSATVPYSTHPFCSRMFAYWLVSDVAMIAYAFFASS